MKKHLAQKLRILTIIALLLSVTLSHGNVFARELHSLVADIQKAYESIETLTFEFTQELSMNSMESLFEATGKAAFKKPGMMKWDYISPDTQQIVSDGKTIWIFQPAFNQVIITTFPKERNVAYDFLSGMGRLSEDFSITFLEGNSSKPYYLKLTPKNPQTNTTGLIIKVDEKTSMVEEFTNFDLLGNATKIKMKRVEINSELSSDLFSFTIPEGAKIVREGYDQKRMEEIPQFMKE